MVNGTVDAGVPLVPVAPVTVVAPDGIVVVQLAPDAGMEYARPARFASHGLAVNTYAPVPVTDVMSPGNETRIVPPSGTGLVTRNGTETVAVAPDVSGEAVTAPPVIAPPVMLDWIAVTDGADPRMVAPSLARVLTAPAP